MVYSIIKVFKLSLVAVIFTIGGLNNLVFAQLISGGGYGSMFVCGNDMPLACGANYDGELGDGTTIQRTIPVPVNITGNIYAISAGADHTLFLKFDSTVWACGRNEDGRLGDGTTVQRTIPIQGALLTNVISMSAGGNHSIFLKNDSSVWSCGSNFFGQLGIGSVDLFSHPFVVQISNLNGIKALSAGDSHSLFLKNDGTVWACGINNYGQLGDGTTTQRTSPVQLVAISGVILIEAGWQHSLFYKNDNTIWACGWNSEGQLDDGPTNNKNICVQSSIVCSTQMVEENLIDDLISVYPNPTNDYLTIKSKNGDINTTYALLNSLGQQILTGKLTGETTTVDVTKLPSGLYFMQVGEEEKHQFKLMKK